MYKMLSIKILMPDKIWHCSVNNIGYPILQIGYFISPILVSISSILMAGNESVLNGINGPPLLS